MTGRVHSLESFGSVDGPGIRFVVFLQGCPLRCAYCHNPDSWTINAGTEMEAEELFRKIRRYKAYFGEQGGVTVSGGEALLQPEFVTELFRLCHADGINTCLDTSGCLLDERVMALLDETDTVLLDIKMTTEEDYREYIGGSLRRTMEFLQELHRREDPHLDPPGHRGGLQRHRGEYCPAERAHCTLREYRTGGAAALPHYVPPQV